MVKHTIAIAIFALCISLHCFGFANAAVISFDELNQGMVPDGYAGLTWGTSILSRPYADSTSFSVNSDSGYSTPHSSPNIVVNGYGVPDLWFEFPAPVSFNGAWFAVPKNNSFAAQKIRFVDDLGQTSSWLELTEATQYLSANFSGSTKIYVQPTLIINGIQTDGGWYTMDDIQYESISNPSTHSFSITLSGTGNGAVNSDPSGYIACTYAPQTGTCASTLPVNTSFTLIASPSDDSRFIGWGGACNACSGLSCEVTLDSDKSCSATINNMPLVQITGPAFYASITKAYAQLSEGGSATMQTQAVELTEDVDLNHNIPLTLIGGYDPGFSTRNGYTILHGIMTIKRGSLIVDRIIVRKSLSY